MSYEEGKKPLIVKTSLRLGHFEAYESRHLFPQVGEAIEGLDRVLTTAFLQGVLTGVDIIAVDRELTDEVFEEDAQAAVDDTIPELLHQLVEYLQNWSLANVTQSTLNTLQDDIRARAAKLTEEDA